MNLTTMHQTWRLILRITHYISPSSPTFSTIHRIHTTPLQPENQLVYDYLITNFNFPKSKALICSYNFAHFKSLEKPESVVKYFKSLGLTDAQIISSATLRPKILFVDVNKTLKPNIQFFQELGFCRPNLVDFICQNTSLLGLSLIHRLKPTVEIIRSIFVKHNIKGVNFDLFQLLKRYWLVGEKLEFVLGNVSYLESCGVSGYRLLTVLMEGPKLMTSSRSNLRRQISRIIVLGISFDSSLFVYGLIYISRIDPKTYRRKLNLFLSFGFTDTEFKEIVRNALDILRGSLDNLRFGIGFYLETVGVDKSVLIENPVCLLFDMRNRVVPRYKVALLLKSKGILENEDRFTYVVQMSEEKFVKKYISRFPDHAEELLEAYKGHLKDSSGKRGE